MRLWWGRLIRPPVFMGEGIIKSSVNRLKQCQHCRMNKRKGQTTVATIVEHHATCTATIIRQLNQILKLSHTLCYARQVKPATVPRTPTTTLQPRSTHPSCRDCYMKMQIRLIKTTTVHSMTSGPTTGYNKCTKGQRQGRWYKCS